MKILLTITSLIALASAQQDLCGNRRMDPQFVDDPSACRSYLWCNFNANNQLVSVHQLVCPAGTVFDATRNVCDGTGATVCNAATLCPPNKTLMVADRTDPTCRRFSVCANGQLFPNVGACTGDSVFNRNFGTCSSPASAPCSGFFDSPCDQTAFGFYRVWGSCREHVFCQPGMGEISRHECPPEYHFNPATRSCTLPELVNPPCPW